MKNAGNGVSIYILDTGIRITHSLFNSGGGNAVKFKDANFSPYCAGDDMVSVRVLNFA
jgi:subtilisin family serine protease